MAATTRRVALMLDLQWSYKRHIDVFAGAPQQDASEQGWTRVIKTELVVRPMMAA